MNPIISLLNRPHPGYEAFNAYIVSITAMSVGIFLALTYMHPFDSDGTYILGNPILTASLYAAASLVMMLMNACWIKLFPSFFSDERWTIGKEIIHCIFQMVTVAVIICMINYIRGMLPTGFSGFLLVLWVVMLSVLLPYLTAQIILHIYYVKRRLNKAATVNIRLMFDKKEVFHPVDPQFIHLKRYIKPVDVNSFIMAESKEDLLMITLSSEGGMEELIIRGTLDEFEAENAHFEQLFRCHNNYVINSDKITWVEGNAAGYRIMMHPKLPSIFLTGERGKEFIKRMGVERYA